MKNKQEQAPPPTYLSFSEGLWRVIHKCSPVCSDKRTAAEAMAAAKAQGVIVAPLFWDGGNAQWLPIEGIQP